MIDITELLEFTIGMVKILEEKSVKYEGDYEKTTIGILRDKMYDQIDKISHIISEKIDWDRDEVKRRLMHIANFCLLLYYKM